MEETKKKNILSWGCAIAGVLSLPFACYWYVGLILAVVSIVLGVIVTRRYERNRMVTAGWICAGCYLAFFLILAIFLGIYYNIINLHK